MLQIPIPGAPGNVFDGNRRPGLAYINHTVRGTDETFCRTQTAITQIDAFCSSIGPAFRPPPPPDGNCIKFLVPS